MEKCSSISLTDKLTDAPNWILIALWIRNNQEAVPLQSFSSVEIKLFVDSALI